MVHGSRQARVSALWLELSPTELRAIACAYAVDINGIEIAQNLRPELSKKGVTFPQASSAPTPPGQGLSPSRVLPRPRLRRRLRGRGYPLAHRWPTTPPHPRAR